MQNMAASYPMIWWCRVFLLILLIINLLMGLRMRIHAQVIITDAPAPSSLNSTATNISSIVDNDSIPTSSSSSASASSAMIIQECTAASLQQTQSSEQACEEALSAGLRQTADAYTMSFADRFSFCVADPIRERDAAFGFQGNLSFLRKCFDETSGTFLQYMCTLVEIETYISSLTSIIQDSANDAASAMIRSSNCNQLSWTSGCEAGWAKSLSKLITNMSDLYAANETTIPIRTDIADIPCCDGFFCPRGLGCMMPCPLGAHCTRASLTRSLCAPYNYPLTPGANASCGGANLWASLSVASGIFCPAGSYCPSTSSKDTCDRGFFCRQGSTVQSKCFQLAYCDEQSTTQHIQSYGVIIIVGLFVSVLAMYNCSNQVRRIRRKRKEQKREKAMKEVKEESEETWAEQIRRTLTGIPRRRTMGGRTFRMLSSERAAARQWPRTNRYSIEMGAIDHDPSREGSSRISIIDEEDDGEEEEEDLYAYRPDEGISSSSSSSSSRDLKQQHELRMEKKEKKIKMMMKPVKQGEGGGGLRTESEIMRYAFAEIQKEKGAASAWSSNNKHMNREEDDGDGDGDEMGRWGEVSRIGKAREQRPRIEIAFHNLSLFLKGKEKRKILCNVSGKLSPGRVMAVMGPSGAGKTSFLNAIAGKSFGSYTTGIVLINGKPDRIECYRKSIGFVPQDDIVHSDLTVEENLWFSANYRLPSAMAKHDKVLIVERIIDALGLDPIRSSKVGSVKRRGISGGQRKRVNVALEMVMEPSLLILDEPTSGLDSTSSFLVLRALRREAYVGVNVGVVLHQPSFGLFNMFDDVLLLAKGGKTVYLGPVDEIEHYFAAMGFVVPHRINPPDHYMDVLEGIAMPILRDGGGRAGDQRFDPSLLPIRWMQHKGYDIPDDFRSNPPDPARSHPPKQKSFIRDAWSESLSFMRNRWDEFASSLTSYKDLSGRQTPWFGRQFKLIISRLCLQRIREARLQTQDGLILLLCGACLGAISPANDSSLGSNSYAFVIIALSLLCMIAALRTFTNDKLEYWRESSSGINKIAYFLAKDTVDHFNTILKPVVFLSMFYFFNNSRSSFEENYAVTLALIYCVTGIAYIFAITLDTGPAQLWSVFLPIILTLLATKKDMPRILEYLVQADYANWALQAYIIANAKRYSGVWLITRCALLYSAKYKINNWLLCLIVLFGMGLIARLIALLCLILCNRKRQQ